MFASCLGDHTPESTLSGAGGKVFYSVTGTAKSKGCVKVVDAASTAQPVSIARKGLGEGTRKATLDTMKANTTWAANTIVAPTGSFTCEPRPHSR